MVSHSIKKRQARFEPAECMRLFSSGHQWLQITCIHKAKQMCTHVLAHRLAVGVRQVPQWIKHGNQGAVVHTYIAHVEQT
eukprot:scaffold143380_cov22-Tisochrysis_lutea.AAC.2